MASIIQPQPMRVQPASWGQINLGHHLLNGATMLAVPTFGRTWSRSWFKGINSNNFVPSSSSAVINGRAMGMAFVSNALGAAYVVASQDSGVVFPNTSECTVFMLRRHMDTTLRAATSFGFTITNSNRIILSAPFSDGVCYWDYGSTDGTHRISASWGTKNTNVHALVFVAGAAKGREIWRNGIKLAGSTSINAASTASSTADVSIGGDLEENYLVGVVARAWSDSEIAEWSANPWGIFQEPRRLWLPGVAAAGGSVRPQVFVCT
jgi:hypothetical protein